MPMKTCHGCDGKGWVKVVEVVEHVMGKNRYEKAVKCPVCQGSGKVPAE